MDVQYTAVDRHGRTRARAGPAGFPRSNPQAHRAVEGGYSGRDRSTFESISMRPSSRKRLNPVHPESAYRIVSASVLFWLTSASFSRSQSSNAGARDRLRSCRIVRRSAAERPRISLSIRYRSAMRISASLAIGAGPALASS